MEDKINLLIAATTKISVEIDFLKKEVSELRKNQLGVMGQKAAITVLLAFITGVFTWVCTLTFLIITKGIR